ncbi:hypothetical protein FLA4_08310 [Candidatus Rickettsia kotlanii]|nr:hypothetical protein FLA4_08310 [Candidatus Rickettsia kotlanii]BDU61664.1 hypothetical protein HM2_08320 [Candidatus Rickettsia kotlanii]
MKLILVYCILSSFFAICLRIKDMSTIISFDYAIKYLLKDKGDYEIVKGFISAILKDAGL